MPNDAVLDLLLALILWRVWPRPQAPVGSLDPMLRMMQDMLDGLKRPSTQTPPASPAPQPPFAPTSALPADPGIWEVEHLHPDGEWRLFKKVRANSDAWDNAFRMPGQRLRQGDHIEEGVQ
jgi:hypothetical protein